MKANLKLMMTMLGATIAALIIIGGQACQLGKSESYKTLSASELTALIETLPDSQKRTMAQNDSQRKGLITQSKQMFSLAQAAQAEGLDKTEQFKHQLAIQIDQTLVSEATKRNLEQKYTEEEGKAYLAAHQQEFEADLKAITMDQKEGPTPEQTEMMKGQWSEMKVRAAKARQAGLDKDPGILLQLKFRRANMLANLYSRHLEKKLKPTPEETKKYVEEHPEADIEKIKQKAEGLLARVNKGEDFVEIAKQSTEDGTREQGGDLGWFPRGRMDPEFEKAAFALKPGQTSGLVKSQFGFHIIRVDDRRVTEKRPLKITQADAKPGDQQVPSGPQEEIKARHIYLGTQEADGVEQVLTQKKVKRALEDATLKYPVNAPEDFQVNVGGLRKGGAVDQDSGRIINPDQKQ